MKDQRPEIVTKFKGGSNLVIRQVLNGYMEKHDFADTSLGFRVTDQSLEIRVKVDRYYPSNQTRGVLEFMTIPLDAGGVPLLRAIRDEVDRALLEAMAQEALESDPIQVLEHAVNWGQGFEGVGPRPEWLTEAEDLLRGIKGDGPSD